MTFKITQGYGSHTTLFMLVHALGTVKICYALLKFSYLLFYVLVIFRKRKQRQTY